MTHGAGYGAGGWGSVPWGGADQLLEPQNCDIFLFDDCAGSEPNCWPMDNVLVSPIITAISPGVQLELDYPTPPGTSNDLGLLSGDASDPSFPTDTVGIRAEPVLPIDDVYTLELTVTLESLPNDFTDITNRHVLFSVADRTGPCAAFFLSKIGIGYAGGVHFNANNVVLDSAFQQIPGTASSAVEGETMTYRVAVSEFVGVVYLFATRTIDLPFIGHQLIAVLPLIDATALTVTPATDYALISVRGTSAQPSRLVLDQWCLSSQFNVPNIAPVASAGQDQAVRSCSVAMLDGSASFDPEGASINYQWRLIDAPTGSSYVVEASDGRTLPSVPFDGFASKLYSVQLEDANTLDPILPGDVVLVGGVARAIVATGTDVDGFYVFTSVRNLPDNLSVAPIKLLRQRGISSATSVNPTFLPDRPGLYKFDLIVFDGSLYSEPSVVLLNVLESALPRACVPDAKFIFNHLSDFWSMVEDADRFEAFWSGLAQVAATELYTLWQHEYGKSIRDIQRTRIHRWMHYDLLLPEPIPELTSVRAIWSGVISAPFTSQVLAGTQLVLDSPVLPEPLVLQVGVASTPAALQTELTNRLLERDPRFTVSLIDVRASTDKHVRITAPFPFSIAAGTTLPVFVIGDSSGLLSGTGGVGVGTKSYLVSVPLGGLDIKEGDLLVLEGIGYRISSVASGDPLDVDQWEQQRLILKDELPIPAPANWTIPSLVKSEMLDFYEGMVSRGDDVFLEVSNESSTLLLALTSMGAASGDHSLLPVDATGLGGALVTEGVSVRLAKVVRRSHLPVSELLVDLPNLQEHIVISSDEEVLRRNVDFFLEEYRGAKSLRFEGGFGTSGADVWEGAVPPERLWAEYSYIDNRETIEANFGIPAGLSLDQLKALSSSIDYLSAVRGLWYAYYNGPTPDNIRIGAQIFLGLPFAEARGVITEIRPDFSPSRGRILVQDTDQEEITRSYSYPGVLQLEVNPATGERYKVGDSVAVFAPLVEGVSIVDYLNEPQWFKALAAQRVMFEVQKYHRYSIRIDSRIFNLDAILLTKQFTLNIKPTYTFPIVLVQSVPEVLEVQVRDSISYGGTLRLQDNVCEGSQGSTMFDDARSGGARALVPEAYWNQFDTDDDDNTPAPTFPVPDADVAWAFDKDQLCPEDVLTATIMFAYLAPTIIQYDTFLVFDQGVMSTTNFYDAGPVALVPATPAYYALPVVGAATVPQDGVVVRIRLRIEGGPGADPTDYLLGVNRNGVEITSLDFDATPLSFEETFVNSLAIPVVAGDAITLTIRPKTGGDRTPPWFNVRAWAEVEGPQWAFDDVLPAGNYQVELPL